MDGEKNSGWTGFDKSSFFFFIDVNTFDWDPVEIIFDLKKINFKIL